MHVTRALGLMCKNVVLHATPSWQPQKMALPKISIITPGYVEGMELPTRENRLQRAYNFAHRAAFIAR